MHIFNDPFEFKNFVQDKNNLLTVPQITDMVNSVNSLFSLCCGASKNMGQHIETLYTTMGSWLGQEEKNLIKSYLGADEVTIGRYGKVYLTF